MSVYRHILLAVDLSEDARRVGQRAMDLARACGAQVTLLHVVENLPVEPGNELMIPPTASVESELMEHAERRLNQLGSTLGIDAERRRVTVGQTKREIIAVAEDQGVDLIVVGRHERHGLALLLGSTADAVMHSAPCDVLAVRVDAG